HGKLDRPALRRSPRSPRDRRGGARRDGRRRARARARAATPERRAGSRRRGGTRGNGRPTSRWTPARVAPPNPSDRWSLSPVELPPFGGKGDRRREGFGRDERQHLGGLGDGPRDARALEPRAEARQVTREIEELARDEVDDARVWYRARCTGFLGGHGQRDGERVEQAWLGAVARPAAVGEGGQERCRIACRPTDLGRHHVDQRLGAERAEKISRALDEPGVAQGRERDRRLASRIQEADERQEERGE